MRRQFPNLLTLLSLVLGFCTLGTVISGRSDLAAGILLWALLFDGAAGQWARWSGRASELGAELDSLAALITFGIAVMVLAFESSLRELGILGWVIAVGAAVAAALRLSRDNSSRPDWPRYQGLPLPAFGTIVALLASLKEPPFVVAVAALSLAVLMLSPLSYGRFSQGKAVQGSLAALVAAAALFPAMRSALLMLAAAYALGGAYFDFWGVLESDKPLKRV